MFGVYYIIFSVNYVMINFDYVDVTFMAFFILLCFLTLSGIFFFGGGGGSMMFINVFKTHVFHQLLYISFRFFVNRVF